jgi:hypothetical protein
MSGVDKTKVYIRVGIFLSFSIFFIVDPFGWIPKPDMSPCTAESKKATCTGRIIFFWQTP